MKIGYQRLLILGNGEEMIALLKEMEKKIVYESACLQRRVSLVEDGVEMQRVGSLHDSGSVNLRETGK